MRPFLQTPRACLFYRPYRELVASADYPGTARFDPEPIRKLAEYFMSDWLSTRPPLASAMPMVSNLKNSRYRLRRLRVRRSYLSVPQLQPARCNAEASFKITTT